ncbi:hypothetical protein LBMAG42_12210 [Deltaproteobacteria bacterium]|nr:hypothetical protein LBMAG42_12210 [Deltaproteobacteria bacterium]
MSAASTRALAHPVTLAAAALVLCNDFLLRGAAPGWLTGKLSDVGWLILVPVGLAAAFSWMGVRERRARGASLLLALATFTTLQLWAPLGAYFSSAHVADAGDLLALPALVLAMLIWRTPRWTTRVPAAAGAAALIGTLIADEYSVPNEGSWPCAALPTWDAATPLRLSLADVSSPIGGDAFLRGLTLTEDDGASLTLVAAHAQDHGNIVVCAREGLRANTTYTWTIGPWEEPSSNEVAFQHVALDSVTFTTGDAPGEPAPGAAACAALDAANPPTDAAFEACDPNPPLLEDTGDSADVDGA